MGKGVAKNIAARTTGITTATGKKPKEKFKPKCKQTEGFPEATKF